MNKLRVTDLDLKGKKVLIRVDFNVPLDNNGEITDDSRIAAALPTIKYVLEKGGLPILMSHMGRPKGKVDSKFSLAPCAKRLATMLGVPVKMAKECVGEKVKPFVDGLKPGEVLLLENLRYHRAEEHPEEDPGFAESLAKWGDLYVNDAFGTAHRVHSSTATITKYFPGKSAMGFLIEKEIQFLKDALLKPKRPLIAIIGGAKISSKLGVIKTLIDKVDSLLIGGGMAYTFLKAKGVNIGDSLFEEDLVDTARGIINAYKKAGVHLELPVDHVVTDQFSNEANTRIVTNEEGIPPGFQGVDIGPKTIQEYKSQLQVAKTIFWNGPLGVFEIPNFAKGTHAIAETVANSDAVSIVGGGDSVAAIRASNLTHKIDHLSTGGGASLEFIEKGSLPGLEVLSPSSGD